MVAVHRPLYNGHGIRLTNGAGVTVTVEQSWATLEDAIYDTVVDIRGVIGGPGSSIVEMLGLTKQEASDARKYARYAQGIAAIGAMIYPPAAIPVALATLVTDALLEDGWGDASNVPTTSPTYQTKRIYTQQQPVYIDGPIPSAWPPIITTDVWAETYQTTGVTFADLLARAGTEAWYKAYYSSENLANAPWFAYDHTNALTLGLGNPPGNLWPPLPDWSVIKNYLTPLAWLNATETQYPGLWVADPNTGLPKVDVTISASPYVYTTIRCLITTADWKVLQLQSGTAGNVPPVWPGLAGVTLGTPVPLGDQLVVTGPLHGVLVDVTAGGGKLGLIELGGKKYYYRAGEVTFETDNGQLEPWQYIGFEDAIYTPRDMKSAANARFRVLGALTGTVTPFTVNP